MSGAASSLDDASSVSEVEDHDYQTDDTTQAASDSGPDDVHMEEVEEFRDREYPQLKDKIYLDHGGTTLYAKSLIEEFSADMISNLYGNPHSASSPSALAGHRVDAIRERTLRFLNADPEEWDLVFTANATAAIKLVVECFRDHAAVSNTPVWYGYHKDSHTSVVGARELTKMHRCFTSDEEVNLWINSGGLGGPRARQLGLFAYPGQSNMTGRRLPLSWPGRIRKSFHRAATYTLLDAAALASTAPLSLGDTATAPDFVALSFYKIFGFPNIGALLVQKKSQHVLENRRYFGGGTVDMVISVNDTWHAKKRTSLHDCLEDGTLPFHSIFALDHGMSVHERLYGPDPMKFISMHTARLAKQMYDGLAGLEHRNGAPLVRIYKDEQAVYGDPSVQGSTIAFNVTRADGTLVGYADVEEAADGRNIYVRSGSLCNPGGVATYLEWSPTEMKAAFQAGHRCSHPTQVMLGKPTGVVRISMGAMSTSSDVVGFLDFIKEVYLNTESSAKIAASVNLSQHTVQQARTIHISAGATTPVSTHTGSLKSSHTLKVPPTGQRPSSRDPSLAPSNASDATSSWETTASGPLSPSIDQQYFPSKLARKGQQRNIIDVTPRDQIYKGPGGANTFASMEIKVKEFGRKPGKDQDNPKSATSKGRKSFGLKHLLQRKGHEYLHPDLGA